MKQIKKQLGLLLALPFLLVGCGDDDSVSEDFNDGNNNVVAKYISSVALTSPQHPEENRTITVNYDGSDRVSSVTDGIESSFFTYENSSLSSISDGNNPFNIDELYQAPYDAFETGEVVAYDANNNPSRIEVIGDAGEIYTGEIIYDTTPNPYFYTMEAAGLIEVLDNTQINFGMMQTATEIVQARMLFPVNNIRGMIFRDDSGATQYEVQAVYTYDSDNYPTSAVITAVSPNEDTTEVNVIYTYR